MNLRQMIDGISLSAAAPVASKPSPVAKHVASHIQDPMGATKEGFQKMQQKKLEYDQSREEMQRNLAPVQSVLDQAAQLHGLTIGNNQTPMPGSPAMGQGMPGAQDNPEVDEMGNPLPPGQTGQPGSMAGQPAPGNGQNPQNMSQTVGKMNSNRPSLAGFQPGVSPGPQESVRPQKLGQAQPGKPIAQNSPQPKGSTAQGNMYNQQAKPPKGNRSLPGAKGPGDPKVENRTKKAQNKSAREIKVHVTASAIPYDIQAGASNKLETQFGLVSLLCGGPGSGRRPWVGARVKIAKEYGGGRGEVVEQSDPKFGGNYFTVMKDGNGKTEIHHESDLTVLRGQDMSALGTAGTVSRPIGSPMRQATSGARPMGAPGQSTGGTMGRPNIQGGPASLSDKDVSPSTAESYNPVSSLAVRSKGKKVSKMRTCGECGKKHSSDMDCNGIMKARGHSLGAKKGWSVRNKHVSKAEKAAHYSTMN